LTGRGRHNGRPPIAPTSTTSQPTERPAYSATAGLPFDDEELESKLLWIWGSPRTGSTWLLEMLCHPLKVNDSWPLGFSWPEAWKGRACALPIDEFLISGHLVPTQGKTVDVHGEPRPATLNVMMEHSKPSYAFSEEFAEVWRPEARRLTLVRLHAVIERARQAGLQLATRLPVLAIKEVNGSHAANRVMPLFPRSKMIFLVRDGRDVLDSLIDAYSPGSWLDAKLARNPARKADDRTAWITELCRKWAAGVDVCQKAFDEHDPALRRQVRYEELLTDTPAVLRELVRWIELPAGERRMDNIAGRHSFESLPDHRKGPGRFRRSATPGRWREGLTPEEQRLAHEVMGTRLAKLGYESTEPA
jgi:hypothetical protein